MSDEKSMREVARKYFEAYQWAIKCEAAHRKELCRATGERSHARCMELQRVRIAAEGAVEALEMRVLEAAFRLGGSQP